MAKSAQKYIDTVFNIYLKLYYILDGIIQLFSILLGVKPINKQPYSNTMFISYSNQIKQN